MTVPVMHIPSSQIIKVTRRALCCFAMTVSASFSAAWSDPLAPEMGVGPGGNKSPRGAFSLAQADPETPAISIETLRDGGISGFVEEPASPVFIRTAGSGVIRSGWAWIVEPGEQVEFEVATEGADPPLWSDAARNGEAIERIERAEFDLPGARISMSSEGRYRLTAPREPGNYPFRLRVTRTLVGGDRSESKPSARVFEAMLLVKTPFDRKGNGLIGDFPIGIYPNENGRNVSGFVQQYRELYAPPTSFIHATPEVESLPLSENFTLGEFVPPMDRGKSSYVAISPRLIELLETALVELRPQIGQAGTRRPLVILGAFLSPNQLMQFGAKGIELTLFTRYQYGDGAAIIWDDDGDGRMDDLNRDGTIDIEDARRFADLMGEVQRKLKKFGGIGVEASPQLPFMPQTPYVDVDMRGVASRW